MRSRRFSVDQASLLAREGGSFPSRVSRSPRTSRGDIVRGHTRTVFTNGGAGFAKAWAVLAARQIRSCLRSPVHAVSFPREAATIDGNALIAHIISSIQARAVFCPAIGLGRHVRRGFNDAARRHD
jgi:hypothetical protein